MILVVLNAGFGAVNLYLGYQHGSSQHTLIGILCLVIASIAVKTL